MKIFALDLSTKAGWAVFEDGKLLKYGLTECATRPEDWKKTSYPTNYYMCAWEHTFNILSIAVKEKVDIVVIEETVPGREVYSQKLLEFMHCCVAKHAMELKNKDISVVYIRTGEWRKIMGLRMTKEDKKGNLKKNRERAKLKARVIREKIKSLGTRKENVETVSRLKKELKSLQLGKITRKHLSVREANRLFGLELIQKDNDIADAVLLGASFFKHAKHADGLRPKKK